MKLYAAYGSNINLEQMAHRCPDAVVVGKGYLHNYELAFQGTHGYGVATVKPKRGRRVPILLWSISEKDEQALDVYEGWPRLYRKETLTISITEWLENQSIEVHAPGDILDVMVYVMNIGEPNVPSQPYYRCIMSGYHAVGFHPRYLEIAARSAMDAAVQYE
jgi:hypothetical protein